MSTTTRPLRRKEIKAAIKDIQISIRDFKTEIEILRRPQRRFRRRIATIAIAIVVVAAFAAHADDTKPAEAQQQLAGIQRNILAIYGSLELTTERLNLLQAQVDIVRRRCTGAEPRPPVWTEPEH
jgi:hypothetical protein